MISCKKLMDKNLEFVINQIGKDNFQWLLLLFKYSKDIPVQSPYHLMYALSKQREKLIDKGCGQDISPEEMQYWWDKDTMLFKAFTQDIFMEYIPDNEFKIIKNILKNSTDGWTVKKLFEAHYNKDKYARVIYLLNMDSKFYENENIV